MLDLASKEWIRVECNGVAPSSRESHTATLVDEDNVVIFLEEVGKVKQIT